MAMDGYHGHLYGRGNARKIQAHADIDPTLLEQVLSMEPDWLDGVSFLND